jgi:hypothetical protein
MARVLIEGVTGAGKTQTLHALLRHPRFPRLLGTGRVFTEEETLGEVMSELEQPEVPKHVHLRRLRSVLGILREGASTSGSSWGFVLERFHLSYYALLPEWHLYSELDQQLVDLDCTTVLLTMPDSVIHERSLARVDRKDTPWEKEMTEHFGSESAAIEAITESQERRRAAARLTGTTVHEMSTLARDWSGYADAIIELLERR